jgi:serine/threonine protein kinase
VQALHVRGIASRDMKPDNVMLSRKPKPEWVEGAETIPDGTFQVADLGLAYQYSQDDPAQAPGGSKVVVREKHELGTDEYMPPEVIMATPRYDFYAGDIWSVGVMLWETYLGQSVSRWQLFPHELHEKLKGKSGVLTAAIAAAKKKKTDWQEELRTAVATDAAIQKKIRELEQELTTHLDAIEPEEIKNILKKMLAWDPAARPTAATLLADNFFSIIPRSRPVQ